MTDNEPARDDPARRLVRGSALAPVVALMALRALARLKIIDVGPLGHWYVYVALLGLAFTIWLVGECVLRRR